MLLTNAQRAEVLCNALPYIQNYTGRIVVVKYGGNAMINEEIKRSVMGDLVLLRLIGVQVVLVHGGGPEISGLLKRIGKAETAEIIVNRSEHIIVEPLASGKHTEVNPMGFTIVVEENGHNPNHSYYDIQ